MKKILKDWRFWALVLLVILIIFLLNTYKYDASSGGILVGSTHELGGVDGTINKNGGKVSLEGNEAVINARTMGIEDKYLCVGTPRGIASSLNEIADGVKFGEGKCHTIERKY